MQNKLMGRKPVDAGPAATAGTGTAAAPVGQAKLEDSNVAKIGSPEDKAARKASAETEPAWQGAGRAPGVQIWRIEKFEVKNVPVETYGTFFNGDSYIVLLTTQDGPKLVWDIFFWLGAETTQDEMGTAAYKTVELDQIFDDAAVQHRECSGHESNSFLKVFPKGLKVVEGGIATGFHHVTPEEYKPRLLRVSKQGKHCKCVEVACKRASLDQYSVFVLDGGLKLWQFEGTNASAFEKQKAAAVVEGIQSERSGRPQVFFSPDAEFWALLGGEGPISSAEPVEHAAAPFTPVCYKLSEDSGAMEFTKVGGDGERLQKTFLEDDDVFIVDTGFDVFVWLGANASTAEKFQAMARAMAYLDMAGRPHWLSITRVSAGSENAAFKKAFASW